METVQLTQSQAIFHVVTQPRVSPDGARVIFIARPENPRIDHIFSVPVGGGVVTRLTEATTASQFIIHPEITADSQRVVFRANLDDPLVFQLYSVPIAGGTVTRLSGDLLPGGQVELDWQLTTDGQWAVFRAEQATAGVSDLYSVPTSGGVATALTSLPASGLVSKFAIAPDDSKVAIISDQGQAGIFELTSTDIAGGAATVLNGPLVEGGGVVDLWFSPDSSSIVYLADQTVYRQFEIFHVAATGGPWTRLNESLAVFRDVVKAGFTSTGARVIFLADHSTDEVFELYSVPTTGGPNLKISGALVSGGDVRTSWRVDPVSQRVIYRADQETDDIIELFSVSPFGGPISKLNGPLLPEANVQAVVKVHEGRVLFLADDQGDSRQELFSVTVNGDDLVRLNDPMVVQVGFGTGGVYHTFQPLGDEVFFVAPQESVLPELFRVPINGGTVTKVNSNDAFVRDFQLGPNGEEVFYTNDETYAGRAHLFQRALEGLGPPIQLNDEPSSEIRGRVDEVQVTPDQTRMIYRASHLTTNIELFTRPLLGGLPVKLSGHSVPGGRVQRFRISPDGSQVVYVADQEMIGVGEIYLNEVEGGALRKLSLPPSEEGAIASPLQDQPFTPDGSRVIYAAYSGRDSRCPSSFLDYQLYSVSTTGGPPLRLNGDLEPCTEAREFEIGSTGERLVYMTFSANDGSAMLFSVPVGGGPSTLLTDAVSGSFALTPDASRVVFSGREGATGHETMFSVPTTGGEPVPLSATTGGVDIREFAISNDGSRVIYLADQDIAGQFELFSVPVVGGPAVQISGHMVAEGDVRRFKLSPGLGRVVFLADKETDEQAEVYTASIQGGDVTRLNHDVSMLGLEALDMEISADSSRVAFSLGPLGSTSRRELHTVPIAGGGTHRVSLPLEAGEELDAGFEISDDGEYVLYSRRNGDSELTYFRAPSRSGLAQRFTPGHLEIPSSDTDRIGFSSDGSRLLFVGKQAGTASEELWMSFELDLFRDGFELGDTSAWSNQVP